jgi:hypothetical protein
MHGLKYDGNRVVSTWMQYPDINLLNFKNIPNIAFNFHSAAPGMPIFSAILRNAFGVHWEFFAQALFYVFGYLAGLYVISQSLTIRRKYFFLLLLVIFVGINPVMILFDNQFYSTSIIAYCFIFLFGIAIRGKKRRKEWILIIATVCFMTFIRPTLPVYIISPVLLYIAIRKIPGRKFQIVCILLLIAPLLACQAYRTIKFGIYSMSSSSSTGVIMDLGYDQNKNFSGIRPGYYPYQIRTGALAVIDGPNPMLNSPLKINGLPNWNYDGYLQDFRMDQKRLFPYLIQNYRLLPHFILTGIRWASINPACSRVITKDNFDSVKNYDLIYSKIFYLETAPKIVSDQLLACNNESNLQYVYFGIFLLILIFGIGIFKRGGEKFSFEFRLLFLLVSISCIMSYTNGSPEMSKYRMETEPVLVLILGYLIEIFQSTNLTKRKVTT